MGSFPPAIYLSENDFDIFSLLQQQNWHLGGPNVHSLSLMSWLTAGVMHVTDNSTDTFIVLHLLTFAVSAIGCGLLIQILLKFEFSRLVSWLAGVAMISIPLVLVQTGYMYTEIPVMTLTVGVVAAWNAGRSNLAIVLALIALAVKLTAIAMVICLSFILMAASYSFKRKLNMQSVLQLVVLMALTMLIFKLPVILGRPNLYHPGWGSAELLLQQLSARMQMVPDVAWLMVVSIGCAFVLVSLKIFKHGASLIVSNARNQGMLICLLLPTVFCSLVVISAYRQSLMLPRYLVPAIPFAVIGIMLFIKNFRMHHILPPFLVLGIAYNASNTNGKYYPRNTDSFSVVERSHAYLDLNQSKMDAISQFKTIPSHLPVFVTKEIYYMLSNPKMGYINEKQNNVKPIFAPPYTEQRLEHYPAHFYLIKASTIHGGLEIDRLLKHADFKGTYEIKETKHAVAEFQSSVYELRKRP